MKRAATVNLTGTGLCMALGVIFPIFFHMLGAGSAFLPMHLPVLLCGLLFGWEYGAACGLIVPLLSSLLTGMPPIFPTAAAMMPELCAYGVLTGLLYRRARWNIYPALLAAMLGGRAVSGLANAVFMGMAGKPYGFSAFVSAAFVASLPGIAVQIAAIPLIILSLEKAKIFRREKA